MQQPRKGRRGAGRRYVQGPHLYQRGETWYAWIPADRATGRARVDCSLGTRDRLEGQRRFDELLSDRRAPGQVEGPADETTLVDIVEKYLTAPHGWRPRTVTACQTRALAWLRWVSGRGIALASQTTPADADAWIQSMLDRKRKHGTVNRSLIIVRKMMKWASDEHRALCGPSAWCRLRVLREDRREASPTVPSPLEVARVVVWLNDHGGTRPPIRRGRRLTKSERPRKPDAPKGDRLAALYVGVTLATGLRISEVAEITLQSVHPGALIVPPSKGHAERRVPLAAETEEALREFFSLRGVQLARNGRPVAINDHWACDMLAAACAAVGLPRFKPHDLRRTFATECRRVGLPLPVIRDLMGHKDTATTERYIGRYREDAAIAVPVPMALAAITRRAGG